MRYALLLLAMFASAANAHTINLTGETGAPVDEDDWSIPLQRCLRSSKAGAGVYDGAERCTVSFALALPAGSTLQRVRALYEDDDANSQFTLRVQVRDAAYGGDGLLVAGKDFDPSLTVLELMTLEPLHVLDKNEAVYLVAEMRGDTRLLAISYDYD